MHDHLHEALPADVRERLGRRAKRLALLAASLELEATDPDAENYE